MKSIRLYKQFTTHTYRKLQKLAFVGFILGCTACSVETSNNGKLDGFWHLEQVDTLQGGSRNMMNEKVYWTFQYSLLNIRKIGEGNEYFLKFKKQNDSIFIYEPYYCTQHGTDSLVTDVNNLREKGINNLQENFLFIQLSDERMTLQNKILQLKFRKL